jgi:hypothetical protein
MLFTASTALSVSASSALTSFQVGSVGAAQASSECAARELESGGLSRHSRLRRVAGAEPVLVVAEEPNGETQARCTASTARLRSQASSATQSPPGGFP